MKQQVHSLWRVGEAESVSLGLHGHSIAAQIDTHQTNPDSVKWPCWPELFRARDTMTRAESGVSLPSPGTIYVNLFPWRGMILPFVPVYYLTR